MLIFAPWPEPCPRADDLDADAQIRLLQELISQVRDIQNRYPNAKVAGAIFQPQDAAMQAAIERSRLMIESLANIRIIENHPSEKTRRCRRRRRPGTRAYLHPRRDRQIRRNRQAHQAPGRTRKVHRRRQVQARQCRRRRQGPAQRRPRLRATSSPSRKRSSRPSSRISRNCLTAMTAHRRRRVPSGAVFH